MHYKNKIKKAWQTAEHGKGDGRQKYGKKRHQVQSGNAEKMRDSQGWDMIIMKNVRYINEQLMDGYNIRNPTPAEGYLPTQKWTVT